MTESNKLTFDKITEQEKTANGIQALANRPNKSSQYGESGFTATELKKRFDKLTSLIADKVNGIAIALESAEASKYISVVLPEEFAELGINTLYDLIKSLKNGKFASILSVPSAPDPSKSSLNSCIYDILTSLSEVDDSITNISSTASEAKETASEAKKTASEAEETADILQDDIDDLYDKLEAYYDTFARATLTYDKEKSQMVYSFEGQDGYEEKRRADLPIKDLEHRLDQLESATLKFTEDSSVAYEKIVPPNSAKYALVNKVGGMTHKASFKNHMIVDSVNFNDSDCEVIVSNNTVTIENTTGNRGVLYLWFIPIDEEVSNRYFTSLDIPNGFSATLLSYYEDYDEEGNFSDAERYVSLNEWIPSGDYFRHGMSYISVDIPPKTGTFTFSLILTDTDDIWQGLRDTKVTELVSEGANIANVSYNQADWLFAENKGTFISSTENSIEGQGIKGATPYNPYTSNGWLTMREGHAIESLKPFKAGYKISLSFDFEILELPSDYTNSNGRIEIGAGFGFIGKSGSDLWKVTSINFILGVQRVAIAFAITNAQANLTPVMRIAFSSLHARVSNIMINYGEVSAPYKPYRAEAVGTFKIKPELIAYLEPLGYGKGVSGYPNYIDFERKVFVQKSGEIDLGTLSWNYRVSNGRSFFTTVKDVPNIKGEINALTPIPAIAEDYRAVAVDVTWVDKDISYSHSQVGLKSITIVDNRYTDAETFRQAVSGKKLIYALETPIEIDISAYLTDDNFIKVEGGGVIRAVNEYEFDAPTTISYVSQKGS